MKIVALTYNTNNFILFLFNLFENYAQISAKSNSKIIKNTIKYI